MGINAAREAPHEDDDWADDPVLRRARELSMRGDLPVFSLERFLSRVPTDWAPGEADVDEFLNSLRGRADR